MADCQDWRVSKVSSGKRDEILLLMDSGYSRSAIVKQTRAAVDIIEHLVANRMDAAIFSSDDKSDGDTTEQESAATPSACHVEMGTRDKRSKDTVERNKLILKLFADNHTSNEIGKQLGLHRTTVQKILRASGKLDGRTERRYQQETAILQLFAEGVSRNEIVRRVKVCKRTLTNILLLYGKSFAQRNRGVPEPLRTTKAHRRAIRALQEKGCAGAQIERQLGIGEAVVNREIYLTQRTEQISSNIEEKTDVLPISAECYQGPNFSWSDYDIGDPDAMTHSSSSVGHQNSPEYPESRPNPSVSPTFPVDESDVHDAAVVGAFAATANSLPDSIQNSDSRSDNLEDPESISTKCTDSALAGRRYRCDLCLYETRFEAVFISHLLGTKHALLARRAVVVCCCACSFRTRQAKKMVGHAVAYQFHCLPGQADVYSIVRSSS